MKTPKELYAAFPYQFDGRNIGIDMTRGWFPLFAKLCSDIDTVLGEDKCGFHWSQVKEKFGTGRFYWDLSGAQQDADATDAMGAINDLVQTAEESTGHICAVCGEPGTLDPGKGYYLTLCQTHIAGRKNDPHSEKLGKSMQFPPEDDFPRKAWQ